MTLKKILAIAFLTALCAACGTKEIEGLTGEYYPMEFGTKWTYLETDGTTTTTVSHEVIGTESIDFGGNVGVHDVYVVENMLENGEKRLYYYEDDGDLVVKLRQIRYDAAGVFDKQRDYDPYSLKYDRSRVTKGETWEENFTYFENGPNGTDTVIVSYQWEVVAVHEEVVVPAGTFDCVVVKRTELNAEEKLYYFAADVGKVKEVSSGTVDGTIKTEELSEYIAGTPQ